MHSTCHGRRRRRRRRFFFGNLIDLLKFFFGYLEGRVPTPLVSSRHIQTHFGTTWYSFRSPFCRGKQKRTLHCSRRQRKRTRREDDAWSKRVDAHPAGGVVLTFSDGRVPPRCGTCNVSIFWRLRTVNQCDRTLED